MLRVLTGALVVLMLSTCGGDTKLAPAAEKSTAKEELQCRDFKNLMPNFVKAIDTGRTANLKKVVEEQLLKPLREGDAPPVNDVLGGIFKTLTTFANQPSEPGAAAGQLCAPTTNPPVLARANTLCEMRRSLDTLVHQGKAIDSVELIQPQLQLILNYLTGRGKDCKGRQRVSHYELATVVNQLCAQDANCQVTDGLDLVIGFGDYSSTPAGKALLQHLNTLVTKPSFKGLYNPAVLSENDAVAIVRGLVPAIQSADAAGLDMAFSSLPLGADLKNDLKPIVDDLKIILNTPAVINPTHRAIACVMGKDKNLDSIRMIYRLAIEEACPEYELTRLTAAGQGLTEVDARGSLVFIATTLAQAVRDDDQAIDSSAQVCRTLFSTTPAPNNGPSNAQLAMPVAAELVENGVVNEAICAADTLLFGCAGGAGAQPACK